MTPHDAGQYTTVGKITAPRPIPTIWQGPGFEEPSRPFMVAPTLFGRRDPLIRQVLEGRLWSSLCWQFSR
jgi:hypothetical protein